MFKGGEGKAAQAEKPKPLTETEAAKVRQTLIDAIKWWAEHLDEFIVASTKGHQPVEIWSELDDEDAEVLAEVLLAQGKRSARVAQRVRGIVNTYDELRVALILAPKAWRTLQTYMQRGFSIR
jgi:hypothetical protein